LYLATSHDGIDEEGREMSSRGKSRAALVARIDFDLAKVEAGYNASLEARSIAIDLKIDIKNVGENLRSVLDYLAHDVRDKYCPTAKPSERFYFPILPDRAQFEAQVDRWYPGLRTGGPGLWAYLESIQPYQSGREWLGLFNRLNNENKHGDLVEQTRIEIQQVRATSSGGGNVSWNPAGVKFGSGVSIAGVPVDPRTQMPVPHPSLRVEKITWVDFKFAGMNVSALWLLRSAVAGIKGIDAEVERHL
jgi:hypothetical protein